MNNPKKSSDFPKWFKINRYEWTSHLLEEDPLSLYWEFRYRVAALTSTDFNSWVYPIIQERVGRLTVRPRQAADPSALTRVVADETYEELVRGNPHPYLTGKPATRPMSMADMSLLIEQSLPQALSAVDRSGRATSLHDLVLGPYSGKPRWFDIKERLSIDTHRYSRLSHGGNGDLTAHCAIDLTCSDDEICESLRSIIPEWRKKLSELRKLNLPKQKTAYRELGKIVDYKLIPILDLQLWENNTNRKITEKIMVAKLANGSEYDFSEGNFRKTAIRMLNKLMSGEWSAKLYSGACPDFCV